MLHESPLFRGRAVPDHRSRPMIIRRERAAISAMETLRAMGANPLPTHRLPNGLGYIWPETGREHGPFRVPGDSHDHPQYGSHYPRILTATDHIGRGTRDA
jgi:hypothetical protein